MYYQQIEKINHDIDRTGRAIITLGCSFVQGQGAVNDELYTDYHWHFEKIGIPLELKVTEAQQQQILARYPNVRQGPHGLDFTFMEYDNAFCNVLATKYFNQSYAAINLGIRGCGNRATIKELYFHPELHWDRLKEIIVVYCPSGLERFDFVNDSWQDHHHWQAMWPHYRDIEPGPRRLLWEGYARRIHSEKFEVIEQISHVQELLSWCQLKNARLIITSGFDRRYTREYFEDVLHSVYNRDKNGNVTKKTRGQMNPRWQEETSRLLELWPWQNMFSPAGTPTFVDLAMAQEFPDSWQAEHFFTYTGTGSKNNWITSCAHPSAKAHDLFAKYLYEHIESTR